MRKIIAFTGYAGAGKDEAAKVLIEKRGYTRLSFAEPMRQAMAVLDPIVGQRVMSGQHRAWKYVRYNQAIEDYGYTEAKQKFPELRKLLQRLGTDVGRNQFSEDFWVEQAAKKIESMPGTQRIVITDLRFRNELDLVNKLGGYAIFVNRPGVEPVNDHVSDTGISELPCDAFVMNDGTIEELHAKVLRQTDICFPPDGLTTPSIFSTQQSLFA